MFPPRHLASRYLAAARRAHLARLAAAGVVVVVPAACGPSDAEVFSRTPDQAPAVTTTQHPDDTAPGTPAVTTTDTAAGTTTTVVTTATTAAATTAMTTATGDTTTTATGDTGDAASDAVFPAGAEVVIDFTYAPSTSGRIHNPYVAVWVEDTDGNLVRTISVWFDQSGVRYLFNLRQWIGVVGDSVARAVTGATRAPGSYSLVWDGTDDSGEPVPVGDYVLVVESAREHGPYQATSATITVSDAGFDVTLPDDGELVDLSATMTV